MRRVVVTRAPLRLWVLALAGVIMMVLAFDAVIGERILPAFGRVVYGPEEAPLQGEELLVWAFAFGIGGAVLAGWALRELVVPRWILAADETGLELPRAEGRAWSVPWNRVIDLSLGQLMELDGPIRALFVVLEDPSGIPDQLRGLVRVDHWTLAVHASGWSEPPEVVLEGLQSLRREHRLA